jgi:hypothetical protein
MLVLVSASLVNLAESCHKLVDQRHSCPKFVDIYGAIFGLWQLRASNPPRNILLPVMGSRCINNDALFPVFLRPAAQRVDREARPQQLQQLLHNNNLRYWFLKTLQVLKF